METAHKRPNYILIWVYLALLTAAELVLAEREDLALMALVQQACCFTLGREPGWNRCRMAFGRYCGHVSPHVNRVHRAPSAHGALGRCYRHRGHASDPPKEGSADRSFFEC